MKCIVPCSTLRYVPTKIHAFQAVYCLNLFTIYRSQLILTIAAERNQLTNHRKKKSRPLRKLITAQSPNLHASLQQSPTPTTRQNNPLTNNHKATFVTSQLHNIPRSHDSITKQKTQPFPDWSAHSLVRLISPFKVKFKILPPTEMALPCSGIPN